MYTKQEEIIDGYDILDLINKADFIKEEFKKMPDYLSSEIGDLLEQKSTEGRLYKKDGQLRFGISDSETEVGCIGKFYVHSNGNQPTWDEMAETSTGTNINLVLAPQKDGTLNTYSVFMGLFENHMKEN